MDRTVTARRWTRRGSARIGAAAVLIAALAGPTAPAAETAPTPLAILPIKLLDTSGEPVDQAARHGERLVRLADSLAAELTRSGPYRATVLPAARLRQDCPTQAAPCLLATARAQGAALILVGVVHKSSTLILQLWARLVDARTGEDVYTRDLNFRGDTDEAWQRASLFLVAQIRDAAARAVRDRPSSD